MIFFNEEEHKYTNKLGQRYISATQFLENFIIQFEETKDFWLYYKSVQYLSDIPSSKIKKYDEGLSVLIGDPIFNFKKYNEIVKYALSRCDKDVDKFKKIFDEKQLSRLNETSKIIDSYWISVNKNANIKGTAFHNWKEDLQLKTGMFEYKGINLPVYKEDINFDLSELEPNVYTELKLWNHNYKLAGTADQVIILPGKKAIIRDWKGLALNTPLATPTGWTTMGEVKVNDEIIDGDGMPTKVIHVSEDHFNPCYKITFDTNETLVADHEHKWEVVFKDKKTGRDETTVMTTEDMKAHIENDCAIKISTVNPDFDWKELPIEPYVLGLWLADGNRTCGTITCDREDIWNHIENLGYETSENHNENFDKTESRTIYGLRTELRKLNLLGDKHIPLIYLRASYNQRLELLRGFMDGDGHFHKKRKRNVMETTSKAQANYTMELVASLGWKPTLIQATTSGFGKVDIPCYHVCFTSFKSPYRNKNFSYDTQVLGVNLYKSKHRYIKSVKSIDTVVTKCLGVESKTHTYLAGKGMIKTHNTNKEIKTFNNYQNLKYPVSHLQDCNLNHYNLQLSIYAWMLEQFGFEVIAMEIEHFQLESDNEKDFKIIDSTVYEFVYLEKEIKDMLKFYKENV
jgi:hypothetical protein